MGLKSLQYLTQDIGQLCRLTVLYISPVNAHIDTLFILGGQIANWFKKYSQGRAADLGSLSPDFVSLGTTLEVTHNISSSSN